MRYSLLVHSLEPKPSRQELEGISVGVPSIAKADCAFIAEDWFGIVTSGLPRAEAEALQKGLSGLGIGSDVVADIDIPALHHDFRCQRVDLSVSEITLTTAMNRRQIRSRDELVFIAAGKILKERIVTNHEWDTEVRGGRARYTVPVRKEVKEFEAKSFFRIDFFFLTEPYRVSLEIDRETVLFYGERSIRMKNTLDLTVLMIDLQSLLPPERMNRCLRDLSLTSTYPRMRAYEEELRWEFYRLGAKG